MILTFEMAALRRLLENQAHDPFPGCRLSLAQTVTPANGLIARSIQLSISKDAYPRSLFLSRCSENSVR